MKLYPIYANSAVAHAYRTPASLFGSPFATVSESRTRVPIPLFRVDHSRAANAFRGSAGNSVDISIFSGDREEGRRTRRMLSAWCGVRARLAHLGTVHRSPSTAAITRKLQHNGSVPCSVTTSRTPRVSLRAHLLHLLRTPGPAARPPASRLRRRPAVVCELCTRISFLRASAVAGGA